MTRLTERLGSGFVEVQGAAGRAWLVVLASCGCSAAWRFTAMAHGCLPDGELRRGSWCLQQCVHGERVRSGACMEHGVEELVVAVAGRAMELGRGGWARMQRGGVGFDVRKVVVSWTWRQWCMGGAVDGWCCCWVVAVALCRCLAVAGGGAAKQTKTKINK